MSKARPIKLHNIQHGMRLSKKRELRPKSNLQPKDDGTLERVVDEEFKKELMAMYKLTDGKLIVESEDYKHLDFSLKFNEGFIQDKLIIEKCENKKIVYLKSSLLQNIYQFFNK